MSFMDKLKKKAEQFDLETKARQLQESAAEAARTARARAGDLATENRSKIDAVVDKAGATIDAKTEGKYADKVARAKVQIDKGVGKVAQGGSSSDGTAADTAASDPMTSDRATSDRVTSDPFTVDPIEPPEPVGRPAPVDTTFDRPVDTTVPEHHADALADTFGESPAVDATRDDVRRDPTR